MKKKLLSLLLAIALVLSAAPAALAEGIAEDLISEDPFEEICQEFDSAKNVEPYPIEVHPTRVSGWAELLWAPTEWSPVMATYAGRQPLTVLKETDNWLMARDEETGDIGYIRKVYTAAPAPQEETESTVTVAADGKVILGAVSTNGAFTLQGRIPEGYTVQPIRSLKDLMVAGLVSEDPEKPYIQVSVAFDERYAQVERLNDLDEQNLAILEKTFTDMDPTVSISFGDTGLGTRLMIAEQNDGDMDYLNILTIYKGYFVEFVMAPSETATVRTLQEEWKEQAIEFLTEMDFVPAEDTAALKEMAGTPQSASLLSYDAERDAVEAEIVRGTDLDTDDPKWETLAMLTLKLTEDTVFLEDVNPESGEILDQPTSHTAAEFREILAGGTEDYSLANMLVTFDEQGNLTQVERIYTPWQ